MSPILVRPVREQLEHDRIIRLLHGKARRKWDAGMNPGAEQNAPVGSGPTALYPDLVLHAPERGHRLEVVIEVETGESVNHLEALAEWAHLARIRAAFHLYVPSNMVDVARQLCDDNHIAVTEFWSFHTVGDDVRFTLIHKAKEAPDLGPIPKKAPVVETPVKAPKAVKSAKAVKVAKPARSAKPAKPVKAASKKAAPAPAAKRAAAKRVAPKRPAPKAKRAPARPAKSAAPRRKPVPAKKKAAARPTKRK